MVLAAGLGTRLGGLTQSKPKALVEVAGEPLLAHVLKKLKSSGFTNVVINVHHFASQIIDYVSHNNFGLTIQISNESNQLLDTGGGIKYAQPLLNGTEPFLVHNVDIFSDIDLQQLMNFHKRNKALATLAVSNRNSSRKLLFNNKMQLQGWKNIVTGENILSSANSSTFNEFAFAGIHVISPSIFAKIQQHGKFSIIKAYLSLCGVESILGYDVSQNFVLDVGKPESLKMASEFLGKP